MYYDAQWLVSQIEAYDTIVIFRHILADADALGSQFGLKTWIEDNYPDKHVYAVGDSVGASAEHYPSMDRVQDTVIQQALAVVLDTSTAARIDDERWKEAKQILRIDHHILTEHYCREELVDEKAAATCEILALLLKAAGKPLSASCANYLYSGLIADTINFTISSTTSNTMLAGAFLLEHGVDIVARNMEHFGAHLTDYYYESWLRTQLQADRGVGYALVDESDFKRFGLTFTQAKEKVFVFGSIHELSVWALFTQMDTDSQGEPLYTCSLRSRTVPLDDIANAYGGGGHRCACGIKRLNRSQISQLISDLKQRCSQLA